MDIRTLLHRPGVGWSQPLPADMDGPRTLVIALAAPGTLDTPGPLSALRAAFPRATLAGCSTAGEIFEGEVIDGSVAVAVVRFASTDLRAASTSVTGRDDSASAALALARQLASEPTPGALRAVLVFAEGIHINGSALVDGLSRHLPVGVVIAGGLAGDGDRFQRTWTLDGDGPRDRLITAIGLYGPALRVSTGSEGGWSDFGPLRHITRSEGPVLFELDGQPVLDLYEKYLGDFAARLPSAALRFPLLVRETPEAAPVVRTILGVDEARRALVFAGDIPQGGQARLMRGHPQRLIDGAAAAVQAALGQGQVSQDQPMLMLSVSCVGRRLVLGGNTEEELESIAARLPPGSGHVGFYAYGEISPAADRETRLHNQTLTVTVMVEDETAT